MASIIKVQDIQNSSGANIINESSNTITIGASGDNIKASTGTAWTGTVAQSSSSSVIENGSNANGKFTKFADGTMFCHMNFTLGSGTAVTTDIGNGGQRRSGVYTKTLPATFTDASYQVVLTSGRLFLPSLADNSEPQSTSTFEYILKGWASATADEDVEIYAIAIGRWY